MKKILAAFALVATLASASIAGGSIASIEEPMIEELAPIEPWTGLYVGGGVTAVQTYLDGYSAWFEDTIDNETGYGIQGIAGYTFYNDGNIELSAEARLGTTTVAYDFVDGLSTFAAFAKAEYRIEDGFGFYALGGYGSTNFSYELENNLYSVADVSDFTYGGGVSYNFGDIVASIDYVVYPSFEDLVTVNTDVIATSIAYKF